MLFPVVPVLLIFICHPVTPEISINAPSPRLQAQPLSYNDISTYRDIVSSLVALQSRRKQSSGRQKRSEVKVCYPEIGCFYETGYIDILPNSPEEINTRFLFYNSKKCRGDTPLLDISAQNISALWKWTEKAFNVSASTKVIIHGFGSSCSNIWVYEMRSALMSAEECNVICVDWESGATIPNYVQAAANTRIVGKQVAVLISGLQKHVNLSVTNIHMIGFSLGAHVAGFAGTELKNLSRITGLDPAGPLFESQDRRARLDSTDAEFVDVIHSNGENLILGGLGAWQPMGHVDFYPNGGRMQKGCTNLFVGAVSDMIWAANEVYGRSLCNHRRAYKFFTDSISLKCQFPAVPCESYDMFSEGKCFPCKEPQKCGNMGYYANKFNGTGKLYLLTRDEEPFCAHQYMIKIESATEYVNSERIVTYGKIQVMLIGDLELNETFAITQKKDEKLVSGEVLSRIIVPHPALQNFFHIQIIYTAYNGWLSTGLPQWSINKLSLIDSYNQKLSVCKENLVLGSGIPFTLPLYPGDCVIHELSVNKTITDSVTNTTKNAPSNNFQIPSQWKEAEDEYTTHAKRSNDSDLLGLKKVDTFNDSWTPLYYYKEGTMQQGHVTVSPYTCEDCQSVQMINSSASNDSLVNDEAYNSICALLQNTTDYNDIITSATFYQNCVTANRSGKKIDTNKSRPVRTQNYTTINAKNNSSAEKIQDNAQRSHNSKSINMYNGYRNSSYVKYLNPPLVEATESWRYWKSVKIENQNATDNIPRSDKPANYFIVHFLPQRLMSFLQKAENYVKLTLVPYMSDINDINKYFVSNANISQYNENKGNASHRSNDSSIGHRAYLPEYSSEKKEVNETSLAFVPLIYSNQQPEIHLEKYIPVHSNIKEERTEQQIT